MTVLPPGMDRTRIRRFLTQLILVFLINVPSISFGLAMGWVSLESGSDDGQEESSAALVGAAAVTFLAGALAMPLAARAIAAGRKPAMLATSAAFIVCWSLKLLGGWGVVAGRAAAGLGGTAAWVIPPMLAVEMCCARVRGAAAVALVLAHNVGFLLMYLAADYDIPHRTVLLCCLGLSVVHFIAYIFVPESPAYLAANGKYKEARASLAWCRGFPSDSTSTELDVELKALPEPDLAPVSPFTLAKDMLSDIRRRKAFLIALVSVVGQEMCGVLTLLQFAECVFHLTRGATTPPPPPPPHHALALDQRKPASDAVILGAVQLVASALALYLVEKIGRRPLLVWGAVVTGLALLGGAGAVAAGWHGTALATLAAAVFADSAGLQPAPYALLAEMFTYQYRGCASLLVTATSDLGNAVEILVFPSIVHAAGLATALAVAAMLTLALAAFAACCVPETMDRTPDEIYAIICPTVQDNADVEKDAKKTEHVTDHAGKVNHYERASDVANEKYMKSKSLSDCDIGNKVNELDEGNDKEHLATCRNSKTEVLDNDDALDNEKQLGEEDIRDVEIQKVKIKTDYNKDNISHDVVHSGQYADASSNLTELENGKGCVSSKPDEPALLKEAFKIKPKGDCNSVHSCTNNENKSTALEEEHADLTECDREMCKSKAQTDPLGEVCAAGAAQTACCNTESTDM